MYRDVGLSDTRLGMILLYTAVNVSLAVWLLKGFIDEIPREYEEAALVDGYTRLQAFFKVVLPQATTGIVATGDLLSHLRVERICLCGAADLRRGADGAAVHPDHHRRRRAGLGLRSPRARRCSCCRSSCSRSCCASICCAGSRSGAAEVNTQTIEERWPRWLRRGPAEMAATVVIAAGVFMLLQPVLVDALHLVIRYHAGRDRAVHGRVQIPGLRPWPRFASNICKKSFGAFSAVRDLTFTVRDGEFFCLLGPSGCGKTTTLRMIAGLELPTSGRILLGGEDVTFKRASQRDIAFVFQLFALYPAHERAGQHRLSAPVARHAAQRRADAGGRGGADSAHRASAGSARYRDFRAATASAWRSAGPSCASRWRFLLDEPLGCAGRRVPRRDVRRVAGACTTACRQRWFT
jgi:hypothetical protein